MTFWFNSSVYLDKLFPIWLRSSERWYECQRWTASQNVLYFILDICSALLNLFVCVFFFIMAVEFTYNFISNMMSKMCQIDRFMSDVHLYLCIFIIYIFRYCHIIPVDQIYIKQQLFMFFSFASDSLSLNDDVTGMKENKFLEWIARAWCEWVNECFVCVICIYIII